MRRLISPIVQAFVPLAAMLCLTQTTRAQDPVKVDPEHYQVIDGYRLACCRPCLSID